MWADESARYITATVPENNQSGEVGKTIKHILGFENDLNLECLDIGGLSICLPDPDVAGGRAHAPGPRPDREGGELEVQRQPSALRPWPGEGGDG